MVVTPFGKRKASRLRLNGPSDTLADFPCAEADTIASAIPDRTAPSCCDVVNKRTSRVDHCGSGAGSFDLAGSAGRGPIGCSARG